MIKQRSELEKSIFLKCYKLSDDSSDCVELAENIYNETGIPVSVSMDIICGRKDIQEFSDYILYHLTNKLFSEKIHEYFSQIEIEMYSEEKYEQKTLKFPLRFENMIQVTDDQWIGKISVKELMTLKDNQLINYNKNTQRSLKRVISKGVEHYKISVNKKAVSAIMESFNNNTYIPNPITLNIPYDVDFKYEDNTIIIDKFSGFDILDGYHRYLSMSNIYMLNNDFNYEMELRIVNFPEDKCQQFIFQEDQKTKMKKVESNSLNQNNAANIIAKKLNEDSLFNLKGELSRDKGLINIADFSLLIEYFFLKDKNIKNGNEKKLIIDTSKELRNKFNILTELDSKYLEEKYTYDRLICAMYLFSKGDTYMESVDEYVDLLETELINKLKRNMINKPPRKILINKIDDFLKG